MKSHKNSHLRSLIFIFSMFCFLTEQVHSQYLKSEWKYHFGGSGWDRINEFIQGQDDHLYITGFFTDSAFSSLDSSLSVKARGDKDIFLMKYNPAGELIWIEHAGGPGFDSPNAICEDSKQNIYIAGTFAETALFENSKVDALGHNDGFLAKYDENGSFTWVRQAGSKSNVQHVAMAIDDNDFLYVSGIFEDTVNFLSSDEPSLIIPSEKSNAFICKYNSSGEVLWVCHLSSSGELRPVSVKCDMEGHVLLSGNFSGELLLKEKQPLSSYGKSDVFVLKLDDEGKVLWLNSFGGPGNDKSKDLQIDKQNYAWAALEFQHEINIEGTGKMLSNGSSDVILIQIDTTGSLISYKHEGASKSDRVRNIHIQQGDIELLMMLNDPETFGGFPFDPVRNQYDDLYLGKLNGNTKSPQAFYTNGNLLKYSKIFRADDNASYYVAGDFWDYLTDEKDTSFSKGDKDIFIAKLIDGCKDFNVESGNETEMCPGDTIIIGPDNPDYSYVWNTGETTPTLAVTKEGLYSVVVIDENGCIGYDTIKVANLQEEQCDPSLAEMYLNYSSGNNDFDQNTFSVYHNPNPFKDFIIISYSLPETCNVRLELFNLTGERLTYSEFLQQEPGLYDVKLNATIYQPGLYLYKIHAEGVSQHYSHTLKLVKLK